jgi:hypothetical protein
MNPRPHFLERLSAAWPLYRTTACLDGKRLWKAKLCPDPPSKTTTQVLSRCLILLQMTLHQVFMPSLDQATVIKEARLNSPHFHQRDQPQRCSWWPLASGLGCLRGLAAGHHSWVHVGGIGRKLRGAE